MDIVEEVAKAIVAAVKGLRLGGDAGLVLKALSQDEQERFLQAARDAIETYLTVVAMPLEVREEISE